MNHNSTNTASWITLAQEHRRSLFSLLAATVLVATPNAQGVGTHQGRESEPNNTSATADALTGTAGRIEASLFTGTAGSQGTDTDFFSFTAPAGSKIYAGTINIHASSQDTVLAVIDTDGTTVLELDDQDGTLGGSSSSIAGTLLSTGGTYYLRVTNFSLTSPITSYSLYFAVQDPATLVAETEPNNNGTPEPLPASGYVSGSVNDVPAPVDTDTFTFSATAGHTVFLSQDLDPERDVTTFNGRIGLGLFGTPPNFLVSGDSGTFDTIDSEALVMTVKTTGLYQVFVDGSGVAVDAPTNTYNFSVVTIPPAATGTITTYTNAVATPIPDLALTSSTITIPDSKIIKSLKVVVDISHTFMPDLDVHLRSPHVNDNGLFTDNGVSTQTGAQNISLNDADAVPIVFTVLNGVNWKPEPAYRLHWFRGENTSGTWTLDIRDDVGGDAGTLNSWSLIVEEEPDVSSRPLIYSEDFEANDGGYTSSGVANEWEYGTPATAATAAIAPFTTAASGVSCWKTDLDNTYDASSNQVLTSPSIDLAVAGGTGPLHLYWQQRYQLESNNFDRAWVRVTEVADPLNTRVVWHADNLTMTDSVGSPLVGLPGSAGWGRYSADITHFAGLSVQVSFHLESDSSINFGGLAIDDVQVRTNDLCPDDPNKTEPGDCGCGVPDVSVDGDTISDCIDNCPAVANEDQADCDGDNVGDACAGEPDCNSNLIPDSCDIANATSTDFNTNGIPDECEQSIEAFCFGDGSSGACPCSNNSLPGNEEGCLNSTGNGGKLVGSGTTSLTNDGLVFNLTNLPGNPGVAFFLRFTPPVAATIHADGLRCSGPGGQRFPQGGVNPVPPGSGNASYGPGLISLVPGTTVGNQYYHAFYRQPIGSSPCGATSAGVNVTNALSVLWTP